MVFFSEYLTIFPRAASNRNIKLAHYPSLPTPHPTPQAMHSMADEMEGLLKKGGAKELERRHPAVWKPRLSGGY